MPSVSTKPLATLRLNLFRGASNIPIYIAQDRGIFSKRGLSVEIQFTPNSVEQRAGLAAGQFDIAHAAVDNAVAMVEVARHDVVIVLGGDGGMNELVVRPNIQALADLRGKALVVDAPNTAYALLARKILKNAGLADQLDSGLVSDLPVSPDFRLVPIGGTQSRVSAMTDASMPDNAAGMLNPPWSFMAIDSGLKSIGRSIDLFGAYQASGAFVMRAWAQRNGTVLERYIAAYVEALRMTMDPTNRAMVVATLARHLALHGDHAERTYQALMVPGWGLSPDAAFDLAGFRNVLALRAEIEGSWSGQAPAPDRYLDLGYYQRALE